MMSSVAGGVPHVPTSRMKSSGAASMTSVPQAPSTLDLTSRTDFASPRTFRRALVATAIAVPLIIFVDQATGGDLFLHPRFPESHAPVVLSLGG